MAIGSKWRLPNKFLLGLMIGVITAKENAGESELVPGSISLARQEFTLQTLWGGEDFLRAVIEVETGMQLSLRARARGTSS